MKVTAVCERSGGWWAITVPDVEGGIHTQARRLDQVADVVIDAVSAVLDVDASTIEVLVEPVTDMDDMLATAREAKVDADLAVNRASDLFRSAARTLVERDVTVRDAGALLGVSPQRISQLVK